jgi:hypothetical protein
MLPVLTGTVEHVPGEGEYFPPNRVRPTYSILGLTNSVSILFDQTSNGHTWRPE